METTEEIDALVFEGELSKSTLGKKTFYLTTYRHPLTCEPLVGFKNGKVLIIHGDGHRSVFNVYMVGEIQVWDLERDYQESTYIRR